MGFLRRFFSGSLARLVERRGCQLATESGLSRLLFRLAGVLGVVSLAAAASYFFSARLSPPVAPTPSVVSGVVLASGKEAVPGAHVLVESLAADGPLAVQTTLTDVKGLFSLRMAQPSERYRLVVRAPSYDSYEDPRWHLGKTLDSSTATIALTTKPPPVKTPDRDVVKTSPPLPSGNGAEFSPEYSICSDPVPDEFVIKRYSFSLDGDRQCGAWSTCRLISSTPKQVCFGVRLQGHNECLGLGALQGKCAPSRTSIGILRVTTGSATAELDVSRFVFVQYAGALKEEVESKVCPAFAQDGLSCIDSTRVAPFGRSRVVYFSDADAAAARQLATSLGRLGFADLPVALKEGPPSALGAGKFEVWLSR